VKKHDTSLWIDAVKETFMDEERTITKNGDCMRTCTMILGAYEN